MFLEILKSFKPKIGKKENIYSNNKNHFRAKIICKKERKAF